jgi:hypothetical protein
MRGTARPDPCPRATLEGSNSSRLGSNRLGTVDEEPLVMMTTIESTPTVTDQDLRPRARTLSWMASMSVAAGEIRAAEGYLLELLAWCAFADREEASADAATDGDGA